MKSPLDMTLPLELQQVVVPSVVAATQEETDMSTQPGNLTAEQVRATAREEAASLLKAEQSQQAIATRIETLTNEKNDAAIRAEKAEAARKAAEVEKAEAQAKLTETEKALAGLKGEHEKLAVEHDGLKKSLAAAQAELAKVAAEKTLATRQKWVAEAVVSETLRAKLAQRAEAKTGDTFTYNDDILKAMIADAVDAHAEAQKALASKPAAEQKLEDKPADSAAASQKPGSETPAQPDLGGAKDVVQAVASMMQVAPTTLEGTKRFAEMFGAK